MMGLVLAVSTATRLLDFWQMGRGQRVFTFITITLVVSLVVFGALTALIQSFKNSKAVTIIGLVVSIITGGALWVTRIGHNLATPVPDQWLGGWGARLVKLADLAVTTVIIPLVVFSILLVLFFVCSNFFPRARGFLLRIHYPIIFCTVFFGSCLVPLFRSPNLLRLDTEIWQRAEALRLHAMTRFYLGDQVISDAIVSKDNWLVFANNFSTMNYQNVWPLTENELEKIHLDLMAFDEYLANNGIKLIVLIAPDKNTIYPEHMPMEIPVLGEQTRLDQLLEYNASRGGIRIIVLRC
jgi:hypothetical protein